MIARRVGAVRSRAPAAIAAPRFMFKLRLTIPFVIAPRSQEYYAAEDTRPGAQPDGPARDFTLANVGAARRL